MKLVTNSLTAFSHGHRLGRQDRKQEGGVGEEGDWKTWDKEAVYRISQLQGQTGFEEKEVMFRMGLG